MDYLKYKNLIYKQCWDFKRRNKHIDIEDLIGEANLIFVKCTKNFNENLNVKFSNYLCTCIRNKLLDYIKKEKNYRRSNEELDENLIKKTNFSFFELSDESRRLIRFVNEFPVELRSEKDKITKQALSNIMHFNLGYKYKDIYNIFDEIKEALI